jgi:hypothetical protein
LRKSKFLATKTKTPVTKRYSSFSVINGNCSFASASDFTTKPSADSDVVLRAVAERTVGYCL